MKSWSESNRTHSSTQREEAAADALLDAQAENVEAIPAEDVAVIETAYEEYLAKEVTRYFSDPFADINEASLLGWEEDEEADYCLRN